MKVPSKRLNLGDDYELCFTVPKNKELKLSQICKKQKIKKFKIGEIISGKGIRIFKGKKEIFIKGKSYNHLN